MSTSKRKIAIEPLSRAGWESIESRLFESLDRGEHLAPDAAESSARKRLRIRAGVLTTTLAAAAAVVFLLRGHAAPEQPLSSREPAPVGVTPSAPAVVGAQAFLADGSRIETTTAPVQSTIGDSILDIASHSSLRVLGNDAQGWLVTLDGGKVDCRVAPRRDRPPFVVQAGETRVTVIGTRFSVERREEGARVVVQEGIVRVQAGERSVLLSPGQSWPDEGTPSSAQEPPRTPTPAARPTGKSASSEHPSRATGAEQRRFERAARLEASDPRAAVRIYRELDRHGAWSANALYARGRLELTRGLPGGRRDLQLYLKRYPSGPNAEDVRALLRESGATEPSGNAAR